VSNADRRPKLARMSNFLLVLASVLAVLVILLGISIAWLLSRNRQLNDLSADQRLRLSEEIDRVSPPVYQTYPTSGEPLFYHMAPNTHYENVLGSNFTTNDLGFRSIPTPKEAGKKRIVVVGDSWTFGLFVNYEETFTYRLQESIRRNSDLWEVYNLAMVGWNTDNELAALRVFFTKLKPDIVVICPTSNDIDDSFDVWKGRLVNRGFTSGAIFRYSYEYQTRWIEVFQEIQKEIDFLKAQGIPTLIYFLPEWRGLARYYAQLSGLRATYTVLPTDYLDPKYRLPITVDGGRHASAEGHLLIARYLQNALVKLGLLPGVEAFPIGHDIVFPPSQYSPTLVEAELGYWWQFAQRPDLVPLDDGYMGREGIFSVQTKSGLKSITIYFQLIDESALYPLTMTVEVASYEHAKHEVVFDGYVDHPKVVTLVKPSSLDPYPVIEVRVTADRLVSLQKRTSPASMRRPRIELH
jgi:hypothetical protein